MSKHYYFMAALLIVALTSCKEDNEPLSYAPALTTNSATDLTRASVNLHGTAVPHVNSADKPEIGFLYATSSGLNNPSETEATSDGGNNYTAVVSGLMPGQTYYYCIFARSGNAVARGAVSTFRTAAATPPAVSIAQTADLTGESVTLSASIIDDGGYAPTVRGFAYALYVENAAEPTTNGTTVISTGTGADFTASLTDLQANTAYIVRPYAVNDAGTGYGESVTFTTSATQVPIVGIDREPVLAAYEAVCAGNVSTSHGFTVTERGFCFSTESQLPTTAGNHAVATDGDDSAFSATLTSLTPNTQYEVRAYAVSEKGTGYSSMMELTTEHEQVVSLTQATVVNLTSSTATITALLTYESSTTITERGICYATTIAPDIHSEKMSDTSSDANRLQVTLTGLSEGIMYYTRAYAVTRDGTFYSGEIAFTTETTYTPTIGRPTVYDLTETGAKVRATISTNGGEEITERGFVYSTTNSEPTTSDTQVTASDTDSGITATLTGLQGGATYYIRAYAVNAKGVGYSTVEQFTTVQHTAPVLSSLNVTDIGDDYATASAYIASSGGDGEEVSERGFVLSPYNTTPTIDDGALRFVADGTDALFTTSLTGLSYGTQYYIRAYAVNAIGTGYSASLSFYTGTTTVPAMDGVKCTDTQTTSLSLSMKVVTDGGTAITACGFRWYKSDDTSVGGDLAGTLDGSTITATLEGLTANTLYYIYGYATNKNGTAETGHTGFYTAKLPPGVDDNSLPGDDNGITSPTLSDVSVGNRHATYVQLSATILRENGSAVTGKGFIWCTAEQGTPTLDNGTKVVLTTEGNDLQYLLTGLTASTYYYVVAYATNAVGTTYSDLRGFTTESADKPDPDDGDNPTPGQE
ncbi:MAG: hypothetical protein LBL97_04870 [Prevotellaceae bacterium]|jgi:hypothetical protein|nr:hypothetical protein [Prevotellaceae bacterium]